jgi:serine/threonine protein kinase
MEYCTGGGVIDMMNERIPGRFSENEIWTIFTDVCTAVEILHNREQPIAHRDLKVENILIQDGVYKLCDFGSATTKTYKPENERERSIAEEDIQK